MIKFDWDEANILHLGLHNITPTEAEQTMFNDPVETKYQVINGEERFVFVGHTNAGRFLTIVWTERRVGIRSITGWDSTEDEEASYWKQRGA